jgi:hypothetical protein
MHLFSITLSQKKLFIVYYYDHSLVFKNTQIKFYGKQGIPISRSRIPMMNICRKIGNTTIK